MVVDGLHCNVCCFCSFSGTRTFQSLPSMDSGPRAVTPADGIEDRRDIHAPAPAPPTALEARTRSLSSVSSAPWLSLCPGPSPGLRGTCWAQALYLLYKATSSPALILSCPLLLYTARASCTSSTQLARTACDPRSARPRLTPLHPSAPQRDPSAPAGGGSNGEAGDDGVLTAEMIQREVRLAAGSTVVRQRGCSREQRGAAAYRGAAAWVQ